MASQEEPMATDLQESTVTTTTVSTLTITDTKITDADGVQVEEITETIEQQIVTETAPAPANDLPAIDEEMESPPETTTTPAVASDEGQKTPEAVEMKEAEETTGGETGESTGPEENEEEKETEKEENITPPPPAKRGRGRPPGAATPSTATAPATAGKRGRKRKPTEEPETPAKGAKMPKETPAKEAKAPKTPKRGAAAAKHRLSYEDFIQGRVVGDRVLSCGEGEQLGHPGRTTSKKPRKVDIVEEDELKIVQVVAGGVHSLLLSEDGNVYTCGINEKGTVPGEGVEPEGSTDEFVVINFSDELKKEGKIVQLTAGASFSAALTDLGSVIAWGNLRDSSGLIDVHPLLHKMKECPVVIVHHKSRMMVKIVAGENHLAMLSADGELLTFGDGSMGQLGRSTRANTIRSKYMCDESGRSLVVSVSDPVARRKQVIFKDVHAAGFWTMAKAEDGRVFAFGLNNFGHLGIPVEEAEKKDDAMAEDERELRVLLPTYAPAFEGHDWMALEGVQHVIARDADGSVYGIGKNTDNALGLGTWTGNDDQEHWKYDALEKIEVADGKVCSGVTAKLGCSIVWTEEGEGYGWGCDTSGQLGLGIKDDDEKVVPKPQHITSAHLDGFKIVSVSIADNHSLFLAKKE